MAEITDEMIDAALDEMRDTDMSADYVRFTDFVKPWMEGDDKAAALRLYHEALSNEEEQKRQAVRRALTAALASRAVLVPEDPA